MIAAPHVIAGLSAAGACIALAAHRPRPPRRMPALTASPARKGRLRRLGVAVRVAGAAAGWVIAGMAGIVVVVTAIAISPTWSRRRSARRRQRAIDRALPEAIELLVLVVRAGRMPPAAVAEVAPRLPPPLAAAFRAVADRVRAGQRFADAIDALPHHAGPLARPVADALAAADRYGLPLAPMLESLVDEARRQRRRNAEAEARQLPVRLSLPLVLCTLPAFVLVAIVPLLVGALSSLDLTG